MRITPEQADVRIEAGEPVYVQMRHERCRVANIRKRVPGFQARIVSTNQWVDDPQLFTTAED